MKKYWKYIIGVILLILVTFFILKKVYKRDLTFLMKVGIYKEQTFKTFEIETTNIISNRTDKEYLDSVVYVGLNELNLDSLYITIRDISPDVQRQFDTDNTLKAHIIGKDRQYMIFIDDLSRDESVKVLAHELIHLKQYYTKKLILNKDDLIWNGRVVDVNQIENMDYEKRPWEMEAFSEQRQLEYKMRNILY